MKKKYILLVVRWFDERGQRRARISELLERRSDSMGSTSFATYSMKSEWN